MKRVSFVLASLALSLSLAISISTSVSTWILEYWSLK